jgi:hypothetical protein
MAKNLAGIFFQGGILCSQAIFNSGLPKLHIQLFIISSGRRLTRQILRQHFPDFGYHFERSREISLPIPNEKQRATLHAVTKKLLSSDSLRSSRAGP